MNKKEILKNIGEFGIIDEIRKMARCPRSVIAGIGDDAAVLKVDPKKAVLFTTDMLLEGRHFRFNEASPYEIGWKALAVNISDIAAMGGLPTYAVAAIGVPRDLKWDFVKELYRGMNAVARRFGACVVGGDTNRSDKIVVSVALLGEVPRRSFVRRSGAKPGDIVFVSGFLGGSYRSRKHLNFIPRVKEAQFLVRHFQVNAMMDLSDGLGSDIFRIASASRVGAFLSKEAIPVSPHAKSVGEALHDGEDFELLFTLPPKEAARLSLRTFPKKMAPFHPVGRIVEKKQGVRLLGANGLNKPLEEKGYDHFRK